MIELRFVQKFVRGENEFGEKTKEYTRYTLQFRIPKLAEEWVDVPVIEVEEKPRLVVADGPPWEDQGEK